LRIDVGRGRGTGVRVKGHHPTSGRRLAS
jgi:hypothetical protein